MRFAREQSIFLFSPFWPRSWPPPAFCGWCNAVDGAIQTVVDDIKAHKSDKTLSNGILNNHFFSLSLSSLCFILLSLPTPLLVAGYYIVKGQMAWKLLRAMKILHFSSGLVQLEENLFTLLPPHDIFISHPLSFTFRLRVNRWNCRCILEKRKVKEGKLSSLSSHRHISSIFSRVITSEWRTIAVSVQIEYICLSPCAHDDTMNKNNKKIYIAQRKIADEVKSKVIHLRALISVTQIALFPI